MTLCRPVFLTLASAGLFAMAFPPIDARALAYAALAPFFVALRGQSRRRRALLGWLWGVAAAYGLGVWFAPSMANYFLQPLWVGFLSFLIVATLMVAPYTVLFALASRRIAHGDAIPSTLLIAAGWVACELLRGRLLTGTGWFIGNPWGLIGYSQVGWPVAPVAQLGSITGIYGVSFVVVTTNAAIALAWVERARLASSRTLQLACGTGVTATVLAFAAGAALERGAAQDREGEPVALVQGNVAIGARWDRAHYGRHLEHYVALSEEANRGERPASLFWPESAMTFFVEEEEAFRHSLGSFLGPRDLELVAGGPSRTGSGFANSVFRIAPSGEVLGRYDKQHLVPLAESMPFSGERWVRRNFGEVRRFDSGRGPSLLPTRVGHAGVLLCNEAMLPEVAGARVRSGAEYLLNPTNDTWIQHVQYTTLQFRIAAMRAIEQRRDLVRVSTAGPSAIIDAWGRSPKPTPPGEPAVLRGTVTRRTGLSLYGRLGDAFGGLCCVASLLALRHGR